jgi:hypothetical protein
MKYENGASCAGRARLTCLVIACLLESWLPSAAASPQTAADRDAARALAEEGYSALNSQQFDIAEDRFRRADGLVHAPTFVVNEGRALVGLGRFVEAQERFQLVLSEGVAENAPVVWKNAFNDAAKLLEEVKPKIGWLTISVANAANAEVKIDGLSLPQAAFDVRRASNPGTREIMATANGFESQKLQVDLDEGAERTLNITFKPLKTAISPKTEPMLIADPRTPVHDQGTRPKSAYVALGIGGLGIAIGTVTGVLALRKRSELRAVCQSGACPPSAESNINAYHSLGLVSGLGFGLGLAAATTGVVLLQLGGQAKQSETAQRLSLRLHVNPNLVRLEGTFQ